MTQPQHTTQTHMHTQSYLQKSSQLEILNPGCILKPSAELWETTDIQAFPPKASD